MNAIYVTHTVRVLGLVTLVVAQAYAQRSPLAQQVFAAESSFAASMANRDTAAFASWLAPDAVFFGGRTVARGKREVLAQWASFFVGPSAPFSWRPVSVEVTESGTLAHSSGPVFDATGKQVSTFNSVWRKEPDGRWRVVFDKGCNCPAAP
jgi:ketosteroid isomerase-like protein